VDANPKKPFLIVREALGELFEKSSPKTPQKLLYYQLDNIFSPIFYHTFSFLRIPWAMAAVMIPERRIITTSTGARTMPGIPRKKKP